MVLKFSFQNTLGAKDDMGACVMSVILSRERGLLDSVHKGSNDGSAIINPGPLGKGSSFFSMFHHVGPSRIEGRSLLQILWESMAAQHALDGGVNPLSSLISRVGSYRGIFFLYTCNNNLAKSLYVEENPGMRYINC